MWALSDFIDIVLMKDPIYGKLVFILGAVAFGLLFFKYFIARDGELRKQLLWLYGSGGICFLLAGIFYDPFYMVWSTPLFLGIWVVFLCKFTYFTINQFGIQSRDL